MNCITIEIMVMKVAMITHNWNTMKTVATLVLVIALSTIVDAKYGYNITYIIGQNEGMSFANDPNGVTYIILGGSDFYAQEHRLLWHSEPLTPGSYSFFIESDRPIEGLSHVVFKWEFRDVFLPYIIIEKIILEPTYKNPFSANAESRKTFCGPQKLTKVGEHAMTLFVPC